MTVIRSSIPSLEQCSPTALSMGVKVQRPKAQFRIHLVYADDGSDGGVNAEPCSSELRASVDDDFVNTDFILYTSSFGAVLSSVMSLGTSTTAPSGPRSVTESTSTSDWWSWLP